MSTVQLARRSRRRTENLRLSPLVPPFTRTKVSTVQEVTSEDREREAESSSSSAHKDQGEYRRSGGHVGGQRT